MNDASPDLLVHLAAGVGDIVMATPLLQALAHAGFVVDARLDADYSETIDLFRNWAVIRRVAAGVFPKPLIRYSHVVPAVPPFYWQRFAPLYRGLRNVVRRPSDSAFYADEQAWYLAFACDLGWNGPAPEYRLAIAPSDRFEVSSRTVVLAPGCKTGEMAAKRWPYFSELAERLSDVAVVGTTDDLPERPFPPHCRSFIGRLSLRETAELLAGAGLVVGNDSGLSHIAAAVGTPTLMIFGPTSEVVLGNLPRHVTVMRAGLPCEPCWTAARLHACAARFHACAARIDCLKQLSVDAVWNEICRTQLL